VALSENWVYPPNVHQYKHKSFQLKVDCFRQTHLELDGQVTILATRDLLTTWRHIHETKGYVQTTPRKPPTPVGSSKSPPRHGSIIK
jgi:hypothetical protein